MSFLSPEQVAAQRLLENFLQQHSSQAAETVLELNGDEVTAVLATAADRHTARSEIKRILAAAYDRRQQLGEEATQAEMDRRQLEVAARVVLERELEMPTAMSVTVAGQLTDAELQQVAAQIDVGGVQDQVQAVLHQANSRLASPAVTLAGVQVPAEEVSITTHTDETPK